MRAQQNVAFGIAIVVVLMKLKFILMVVVADDDVFVFDMESVSVFLMHFAPSQYVPPSHASTIVIFGLLKQYEPSGPLLQYGFSLNCITLLLLHFRYVFSPPQSAFVLHVFFGWFGFVVVVVLAVVVVVVFLTVVVDEVDVPVVDVVA